ncbi:MAG: membrane dipeptidase [Dehalococcoidia bacterium]|nr:MAG: membrane dipeptidase [Dehalococcoidia bacterium]
MSEADEARALQLHRESIVIDGLNYVPDVSRLEGHFYDSAVKGGVTAANFTVPGSYDTPLQALKKISTWHGFLEEHSDRFTLVTAGRDIEDAKREGKIGVIMGSQNAAMLGDDLGLLRVYKRLGLGIIQLSYYAQNLLGGGCGERTDVGLSAFGIEVVEEMNKLGLVIDISHCSDQVRIDAMQHSKTPLLITHSNPRALVNHPRNTTDEQMKTLAEKGGVIGVVGYSLFCEIRKGVRPTLEDYLHLIDYTVGLVGTDCVGLGLDVAIWDESEYEAWAAVSPGLRCTGGWIERSIFTDEEGWDDVSQWPQVTKGLVARGYSDQDIKKMLGLNFLRVLKEVWGG